MSDQAAVQRVLAEEMAHGAVFVLPSLSDGFGMVVAQAMACGLPVIVSENTGARDSSSCLHMRRGSGLWFWKACRAAHM